MLNSDILLGSFAGLRGLVFDCDGVLLDSRGANIAFYNYLRAGLHLPALSQEQEDYVHMSTFEQALDYMIPQNLRGALPELMGKVETHLDYYSLLTLEDGLADLLDWLKVHGVRLGMCTNRIGDLNKLLGRFGLEGYFEPIKTASNSTPKPSPDGLLQIIGEWGMDPLEIAFVGDSKVDESAARAAGTHFWSFKNDALEADLHIPSFTRLHNWMLEYASGHNISPAAATGGF